ncbi:MAG TPA: hypothetical protein VJJ75_01640 [Candidatus Nanoarchaeia archaeon]|nr:hypothetical protein [Candidatus Nanoarchaeia archaeon]
MKSAYATTARIFEQVSMRMQPGMYEQLKAIQPNDIVVVKGQYDHIEKLMDTLKVPYALIDPSEIATHNGGRVMLVNCITYEPSPKREKAVKAFVEQGGRLVTTDWAVGLVERVFPGKLVKAGKTGDDVVEINCNTDLSRIFMGMSYAQCHPKWWLESSSDLYTIGKEVLPVITSEEMQEKYGNDTVVAGFAAGRGEVFHFISHLELQRTKQKTKQDSEGLEQFLEKMGAQRTVDMEDATFAELEAAYSTLNTLAHLCVPTPLINSDMKSVSIGKTQKAGMTSKGLL